MQQPTRLYTGILEAWNSIGTSESSCM